jgi:hypothetical protein
MPDLIDHVGYFERSLRAAKLPISVMIIGTDGRVVRVAHEPMGDVFYCIDHQAKACYTALRARLLNEVRE